MSVVSGDKGKVVLGTNTIAELARISLNRNAVDLDASAFGSTWGKHRTGLKTWTCSVSGHYDPDDTNGQDEIESAFNDGSKITDIKIYIDGDAPVYYAPDTDTESDAGCYVQNLVIDEDIAGLAEISFDLLGWGPIVKKTS